MCNICEGKLENDKFILTWGVTLVDDDRLTGNDWCILRDKIKNEDHSGFRNKLYLVYLGKITIDDFS